MPVDGAECEGITHSSFPLSGGDRRGGGHCWEGVRSRRHLHTGRAGRRPPEARSPSQSCRPHRFPDSAKCPLGQGQGRGEGTMPGRGPLR